MSRFLRPVAVTLAVGLPFVNALSDSSHRRGIARQGHSAHAHSADASGASSVPADAGQEEQPVEFNAEHYPKGLNAGFLTRSKEQVVEFYGPRFENGEARDIAANQVRMPEKANTNTVVIVSLVFLFFFFFFLQRIGMHVYALMHISNPVSDF